MSKIILQSSNTGTGNITINAPVTDTDRTFVLPDDSGSILTTSGGTMTGPLAGFTSTGITDNATTTSLTIDSDGRVLMPSQPAFYAYGSTNQSWSGAANTQILQLGTSMSLGGKESNYNTSTYTFTAPCAGTYAFFGRITQTGSATGPAASLYVNGSAVANEITIGYYTAYMTNGGIIITQLEQNDSVNMRVTNYNATSFSLVLSRSSFAGWLLS
jgi:hypothetical protein